MRFLVASLALVSVLIVGTVARAEDRGATTADAPASGTSELSPTGRCLEQPMSLAIAIAEYEASRALPARAVTSRDDDAAESDAPRPVLAPSAVPHAPPGRTCLSPTDPGCQVHQTPTPLRTLVHLERADHGTAPAPLAQLEVPPAATDVAHGLSPVTGRPLDGHRAALWRPPRA